MIRSHDHDTIYLSTMTLGLGKKLVVFTEVFFTGKIPVFYQYFTTSLRAEFFVGKLRWLRTP